MRASFFCGALIAALSIAACDDSGTGPGVVEGPEALTVDAGEDWAYVTLGDPATVVDPAEPRSSSAWDVGFFATSVMLNGGDAGPGRVEGYCVCQNTAATDADVIGMTAASELSDFEAVTVADLPASEEAWQGDALVPAIDGWWDYDMSTHTVTVNPDAVWKVRTAEGTGYAKLHVVAMEGESQANAGVATLEFAVQPSAGAEMGPVQRLEVDLTEGPVYVDLLEGAVSDASDWDLLLDGYTIRVNGGVSGEGSAGALPVQDAFDAITDASDLQSFLYRGDAFGGVFESDDPARKWYRYDLEGNHQVWPTYNVYLVRRGDEVWKVQLIGYYGEDGTARQITFRYAPLE